MSYLLPFLAAGLSFAVFRWVKYSAVAATLLCLIGPVWLISTMARTELAPNNHPKWVPRKEMIRALKYLSDKVPANRPLIVDHQTSLMLAYYLGNDFPVRLVKMKSWVFNKEIFLPFVREANDLSVAKPGETIWAMSTGWWGSPPLKNAVPKELLVDAEQFGQINFVEFKMPFRGSRRKERKER